MAAKLGFVKGWIICPVLLVIFCTFFVWFSDAADTITPGDKVMDSDTLVSAGGVFELGFFEAGDSSNYYLGIWFKNDREKKPVWVANRENPLLDSSGVLQSRYDGNLLIIDRRMIPIIVNIGGVSTTGNTTATLLDSGNLVLRERETIVWQSFDYPSDTFLPGMKLGWFNLNTDQLRKQYIVSWLSPIIPTTGAFALGLDKNNQTQFTIWGRDGTYRHIGFWNGQSFRFFLESSSNSYNISYVSNENETYLTFNSKSNYTQWFVLESSGQIVEFSMSGRDISIVNHSLCEGISANDSKGCLIPVPSKCIDGDTFIEIIGSMSNSIVVNGSVHLGPSDCEIMCRSNCSCTAFASFRNDGTGCQLYYGEKDGLLGIIGKGDGIIYVRGEIPSKPNPRRKRRLLLAVIGSVVSLMVLILVTLLCYLQWRNHKSIGQNERSQDGMSQSTELLFSQLVNSENKIKLGGKKDYELPSFSFSTIATATNNFFAADKIGEGGFGPVYKGKLLGHEIAVKRLCKRSRQGLEEFKNEVLLISKLQHRNLVRLLGCCIQGEEKILIYEYMPNKSLDSFLFDPTKQALLDWRKRAHIIEGIAQGLLYLHKYSRLRIIHRDLKTSNILLDRDHNPKISDFGMARIFGDDENRAKTNRVVGTYGYMSPEYAVYGHFSVKSDVFSFGVIVLEIMSGKKNLTFYQSDRSLNLLGYAWDLWQEGRGLELMDPTLDISCSTDELMQFLQVGLLCVQESAEDRPTMSDVVSMLSNGTATLPVPKKPAFSTHIRAIDADLQKPHSLDDVTISEIEGR